MKILKMLVLTIIIFSLAVVTAGQSWEEVKGFIKTIYKLPISTGGSTKIDPPKFKFLSQGPCRITYGGSGDGKTIVLDVIGIVAKDVELSDDTIATELLQMGIAFGREQCPSGGEFYDDGRPQTNQYFRDGTLRRRAISLSLYFGDPTTFTSADIKKFFDDRSKLLRNYYDRLLDNVYGYWRDDNPEIIINYTNYPKAVRQYQAYTAQKAREQEAVLEQQRQAIQMRQNQIATRTSAFVKRNKVKRLVTMSQLATNPFVFKGQVVAFDCIFDSMSDSTEGIFVSSSGQYVVVSGVPTTRFTQQRVLVILAGRVLGKTDINLGGRMFKVPHLSFVGNAFCQEQGCRDYATP